MSNKDRSTERKAIYTAVRILLEGIPGAADNVVRADYPAFAELVDGYLQVLVNAEKRITALETLSRSLAARLQSR